MRGARKSFVVLEKSFKQCTVSITLSLTPARDVLTNNAELTVAEIDCLRIMLVKNCLAFA